MLLAYFAVLASSIVISACLTFFIRNLAARYRWTTCSNSPHHIHERQVPRLGGLAVFLTFFFTLGIYVLLCNQFRAGLAPISSDVLKLLFPALLLFATGLLDDLLTLTARSKLLGQIIGGVVLYAAGLHLFEASLRRFYPWSSAGISLVLTVFLVVLICNAMNLIDGLDGLASGVSLFSMTSILVLALVRGQMSLAVSTLLLSGSVAGFLIFNFYPASIFLGDSGSMFLGFMLSGFVISLSNKQGSVLNSLMLPLFCFALPLADTSVSILRRLLQGRSPFRADRRHVHHMLLKLGFSHSSAVWILYGVAAVATLLSLVLISRSRLILSFGVLVLFLLVSIGVRKLKYHEFAEARQIWQRTPAQPLLAHYAVTMFDRDREFLSYISPDVQTRAGEEHHPDHGRDELAVASASTLSAVQTESTSR